MNMVSVGSQKYIIMQKKFEFEIAIQIHRNRTCRRRYSILWNVLNYRKKKDL
jgi:hypothetical protein